MVGAKEDKKQGKENEGQGWNPGILLYLMCSPGRTQGGNTLEQDLKEVKGGSQVDIGGRAF